MVNKDEYIKDQIIVNVGKLDLVHGPHKTAGATIASRFVASDNLDVT